MDDDQDFWFPAKRYGWGWGLPVKWQGWLVLLAYIAVIMLAVVRFPPTRNLPAFLLVVVLGTISFVVICWWKGEQPRWRWGEDS